MSYIIFKGGIGREASSIKRAIEVEEDRLNFWHSKGHPINWEEPCILVKGKRVRRYLRTYRLAKKDGRIILRPAEWYEGQRDDLIGKTLEQIEDM